MADKCGVAGQFFARSGKSDFFWQVAKIPALYIVALDWNAFARIRAGECQLRRLAKLALELSKLTAHCQFLSRIVHNPVVHQQVGWWRFPSPGIRRNRYTCFGADKLPQ